MKRINYFRLFQLKITLIDSWNPDKVTETKLTISMLRNVFAPQFSSSSYTATVYENVDVGQTVLRVNATDGDGVSFLHCLLTVVQIKILSLIKVDTLDVLLRKSSYCVFLDIKL